MSMNAASRHESRPGGGSPAITRHRGTRLVEPGRSNQRSSEQRSAARFVPCVFIAQVTDAVPEGSAEVVVSAWERYHGSTLMLVAGTLATFFVAFRVVRSVTSMSSRGSGLPGDVRRTIKSLEDGGNLVAAADVLNQHDAFDDAVELYMKAGDFMRAGEALERSGNTAKAVQMYRRAGAPAMAAQAYVKRGQFSLAAREYEAAESWEQAAEAWAKSGDHREAAEMFARLRRYKDAGESFERLRDMARACEMYLKHFESQMEMARNDVRAIPEARELARKVADWYESEGRDADAAELLVRASFRRRAAEIYEKLGRYEEAAAIYIEANKPMYAAKLYDSIGDTQRALAYRAIARMEGGDREGAASDYAAAGENLKAAEIFNELGDSANAAVNYEIGNEFRLAAELYRAVGDLEAAARSFEKAADYQMAAELYRELKDHRSEIRVCKAANNFYRWGEILLEHERHEDALAAFQRVDSHDPNYVQACTIQGDILRKLGRHELALQKFDAATQGAAPAKNNVEVYYRMALAAEEAGQTQQALEIFEKIVGVDYYFRDAAERATALRGRSPSAAGAPQSTGALPAAPDGQRRYEIIEEIARGGMGVVYKAFDTVLERIVAFKILSSNLKTNEVAVKYFLREARAAAKMQHPNIVTVFDAGEQDDEFYMAMEYVEGQTLKALVQARGAFPEKSVRYVMDQVCRGLTYAHERGLVHRDIKPGNLMLSRDRVVKIMDFGLAKFVEEVQANHTRAIGTPYYMSPEQIVGKELDGRSDIYSLGISMFECSTGQVPFGKGDLSYHHLHTAPPRASDLNPEITEELTGIILKCMEKVPDKRFRNVTELRNALRIGG